MRFEGKHNYYKQVHRANHNNINLTKSLANKHQNLQVYHLLSQNFFLDLELGSIQRQNNIAKNTLIQNELKCSNFNLYNWIDKKGIKYQVNDIILFKRQALSVLHQ